MYRKILVPVDGSDTGALGLREGIKLAREQGASLRVVHIVNEFIFDPIYNPDTYSTSVLVAMRDAGRAILDAAAAEASRQGVDCSVVLLECIGGPAAELIIAQAREWGADLIVMGTHGRRGLRRLAMGSDAEGVLRTTEVPLLLIRSGSQPAATAPPI